MSRIPRIVAVITVVAAVAGPGPADARTIGDSRVIAKLPRAPGYPEGIVVSGNRIHVATQARFGSSLIPPLGLPEVQTFNRVTGNLVRRIAVADADPMMDHGLSGLALDGAGRLYVLDTQWGVLRFDPSTAPALINPAQNPSFLYASAFPNLPPCVPVLVPPPCAPTPVDTPSLPNDIVFAANGDAYVTDSLQATIWRIPSGGGAPQIWFQDASIGGAFGPNGIRLNPARTHVVFAVTASPVARGVIFRLPLAAPTAANLEVVHQYLAAGPDNLAFGQSGKLYVALAVTNQVGVLAPNGSEIRRFSGPAKSSSGNVPYDMPSGVAIDPTTRALLVNNHSEILGLPSHFVVFDVYVNDGPDPLETPVIP